MRRTTALLTTAAVMLATLVLGAPPAAAAPLPGLSAPASIARDVNGIAHLDARNEQDLFFLQGWVHAQDRLFQMDLNRRQPSGTAAELLGQAALPGDVQARTIGLRRAADRSLAVLSDDARGVLAHYTRGVNAWVAANGLPQEYADLGVIRFEPWTVVDSLVAGKAVSFQLSFGLDIDRTVAYQTYLATGQARGFDGDLLFREDAFRIEPFSDASTVPDALDAGRGAGRTAPRLDAPRLDDATVRMLKTWRTQLEQAPPFLAEALREDDAAGSNQWGISAELSPTGRPIIANDPHLGLGAPSTFYPIHLTGGRYDVAGNGFPGLPGVILGRNADISWGATTNPLDVTDTYAERVVPDPASPSGLSSVFLGAREQVQAIPETFRVNSGGTLQTVPPGGGVPTATLIVPRRNNGPLVQLTPPTAGADGSGLSVQYAGFSGTAEIETFLRFDRATGLADFQQALTTFDVGSQNWAVADTAGNLAYLTSAELPLREDLQAGTVAGAPPYFIRNGQGGNEWLARTTTYDGQALPYEILPPAEMPQVVNPPAGFFVNANNDPAGTNLDNDALNQLRPGGGIFYLNAGYDGFRAGRITDMISFLSRGGRTIGFAEVQRMQADVTMIDAQVLVPYLLEAFDAGAGSSTSALRALAEDPRVVEAVGRLRGWDASGPTGTADGYDAIDVNGARRAPSQAEQDASVAATIWSLTRSRLLANTLDAGLDRVGLGGVRPGSGESMSALRQLLEDSSTRGGIGRSGVDFFVVDGVPDAQDRRDVLLLRSLAEALDALAADTYVAAYGGSTDQDDYRWGRLHRHVFAHPLGGARNIPPATGLTDVGPGLAGVATDGGFGVVDASSHSPRGAGVNGFTFASGPVQRFVSEVSASRGRTVTSTPGGTSGDVRSDRYATMLPSWLTNDTYRQLLREPGLRGTFVEEQAFEPAGLPAG